jgi:hypothetical protein
VLDLRGATFADQGLEQRIAKDTLVEGLLEPMKPLKLQQIRRGLAQPGVEGGQCGAE